MLAAEVKNQPILQIHNTTLPHLDFVEKILLDELIRLGKAEIIQGDEVKT